MLTFVPAPGAVSTTRPNSSPNTDRSRSSTLPSPTCSAALGPPPQHLRIHSHPVVLDADQALGAGVLGHDRHRADSGLRRQPVPHGVLHQRLQRQERHRDRQHLRRDLQPHLQPLAEAGPLQREVAVDRAQLLGQRGELAVRPERVAGELGELQQQLARPLRVGPDEGGDRGQRVVDEVRADLRPQRAHLGPHQPGPGLVELGQLQLGGHPAGGLQRGLHQTEAGLGRGHRCQRADDPVVHRHRHHHRARGPGTPRAGRAAVPAGRRPAGRTPAGRPPRRAAARRGGRPAPPTPAAAGCR